jgi:oligopeptidase A
MSNAASNRNPLLEPTPYPRFDEIKAEHVVPAMTALLGELDAEFETLEAGVTPTWNSLVVPLERIGDRLGSVWGAVIHLMGVKNSPELREAHAAVQPKVVEFGTRLAQSRPIFDALCAMRDGEAWGRLDPAQRRIAETMIRDATHSGVGLDGAAKERFNAIQLELAGLSTRFGNNVLDATKAFALQLTDPAEVEGLPPSVLAMAAQMAREAGAQDAQPDTGPWRITLDGPMLVPFLEHARRRDLREKIYRAYITRASSGDNDNTSLIESILAFRREEATLLGFDTYAELSLASKMAPDVAAVRELLGELRAASYDAAQADLNAIRECAGSAGGDESTGLQPWDVAFWAERLREARYELSEEELRPYFPLPRVLEGLFGLAERLFGIRIEAADGAAPVWHQQVRFFNVSDSDGTRLAAFYLDA